MTFKLSATQKQRDADGRRDTCCACGHDKTGTDPLVISEEGWRVHQSHYTDPATGFYGRPYRKDET